MKTFRVIRKVQIGYLVFLLFMLMAAGFMIIWASPLFSPSTEIIYRLFCGFFLVFTMIPVLFAIWLGFLFYAARKAVLVFDDKGIQLTSLSTYHKLLPFWLKPYQLKYEEIVHVGFGETPATIELVDQKGRKTILLHPAFDDPRGEAIVEELGQRLPVECFEPGWPTPVPTLRFTKTNKIQTAILLVFAVLLALTLALDNNLGIRNIFTNAWEVEKRFPIFQYSEAFSLESPDGYWAVTDKLGQYYVYHINNEKEAKWKMPPVDSKKRIEFVSGVAFNPIVWTDREVWSFNGGWKNMPYKNNLDLSLARSLGFVPEDRLWAIVKVDGRNQIIQVDDRTGNWDVVPLPVSTVRDDLEPTLLRRAINNDILVMVSKKGYVRFHLFSDGAWRSQEYFLKLTEPDYVLDFYLDTGGNLWVLYGQFITGPDYVAKLSPAGEVTLTHLPLPSSEDGWDRYDSILVDPTGRMWISGNYPPFISVFLPNWNGEAEEMAKYSEYNSNYRQDHTILPVMSSDGRIWTVGYFVSVMDSNLEELPAPLPGWFSDLDMNMIKMILLVCVMIFQVYMIITQKRSRNQLSK